MHGWALGVRQRCLHVARLLLFGHVLQLALLLIQTQIVMLACVRTSVCGRGATGVASML